MVVGVWLWSLGSGSAAALMTCSGVCVLPYYLLMSGGNSSY